LTSWLSLGLSAAEFWDATPRILHLTFKAHDLRLQREHNDRAWLAWHTAYLHRVTRMPPLSELLFKPQSRAQTPEQMREIGLMIYRTFGGSKKKYDG